MTCKVPMRALRASSSTEVSGRGLRVSHNALDLQDIRDAVKFFQNKSISVC